MPANLTQQYHKAEAAYRRAATPDEELECLQVMFRELPKHKGTDKLQSDLKQKISKLKKELASPKSAGKSRGTRIPRQGAGRVVLLGAPNAGKSQYVDTVTRANPAVAEYPFTTHEPTPAMLPYEDVLIQLIDTPPITEDLLDPAIQGLIRGADLCLLFLDLGNDDALVECKVILDRLSTTKTRLGQATCLSDEDVGLSFTETFLVLNKTDLGDAQVRLQLFQEEASGLPDLRSFEVSAKESEGLEELAAAIFTSLNVVRVYTKLPNAKEPDYDKPFTVRRGATLADVAALVHKDFVNSLKFARVWGSEVHDGTTVKSDYLVHDKDVVELHT